MSHRVAPMEYAGCPPGTCALGKVRPFVKWAGGKTRLLQQLRPLCPKSYGAYFEPFVGGGALFLELRPRSATLNDLNSSLIAAYRNIRDNLEGVLKALATLEERYMACDDKHRERMFYKTREHFNASGSTSCQRTAELIFLNKTCFNGMYRESADGRFNVPFGRYAKPKILDAGNLMQVSHALQGARLTSISFEKAVGSAGEGDFVYFDPPYYPLSSTSSFTGYQGIGFGENDQVALRDLFVALHRRGCFVMASNSHTRFVQHLFEGFPQHTVLANRAINCKAAGRGKIRELVVTNYNT